MKFYGGQSDSFSFFFPVDSKAKVKECILTKTKRDVTNGDSGNEPKKKTRGHKEV